MKKDMKMWPVVVLACALSACGTAQPAGDGMTRQNVTVRVPGQSGVHCFVNAGGEVHSLEAPAVIAVRPTPEPLSATCFKGDHMSGTTTVDPVFSLREADRIRGTKKTCMSCRYPDTVTVGMTLTHRSFERGLQIGLP